MFICPFVCLFAKKITQKVISRFKLNFQEMLTGDNGDVPDSKGTLTIVSSRIKGLKEQ